MIDLNLLPIKKKLTWTIPPVEWDVSKDGKLSITSGKATDLFVDPQGEYSVNNSPRLMFVGDTVFQLSAKVEVSFRSDYDAGGLLLYQNDNLWAKLCFELSPQKKPTIVTVVNSTVSDDCNSTIIENDYIFLRVTKLQSAFAFHYSSDSKYWHLVRYFRLEENSNTEIGFFSQSPTGNICITKFSEIKYSPETITDIRNGE